MKYCLDRFLQNRKPDTVDGRFLPQNSILGEQVADGDPESRLLKEDSVGMLPFNRESNNLR